MTLIFATHNPNKVREIQSLMPENIIVKSLTEIGCHEEIEEDASTLKGNALKKARYVRDTYGFSCFADDTGLMVDALNGAPGVYSARYAGEHKSSEDNLEKLLRELKDKDNRKAHFKTTIALIKDGQEFLFEGICKGEIINAKRGEDGFGYDPVFQPDGYDQTFAEMPLALKNKIGHRGKAVKKLIAFLEKNAV